MLNVELLKGGVLSMLDKSLGYEELCRKLHIFQVRYRELGVDSGAWSVYKTNIQATSYQEAIRKFLSSPICKDSPRTEVFDVMWLTSAD